VKVQRPQSRSIGRARKCLGWCAALAACSLVFATHAAVPVEESVEDSVREARPRALPLPATRGSTEAERVSLSPSETPVVEGSRDLGIPPTIEPTPVFQVSAQNQGDTQQRPLPMSTEDMGAGQLSELFYQLQVLQQEIQNLRGQVEEQAFLVNRLQREQKEQYLDLDRRLVAQAENQPPVGPSATLPPAPQPTVGLGTANLTEREAYTRAFEAMRARQFDASMLGFQQLIETYPNGKFTPNAYYWIGELYLVAKSDAELARQSFMQVVNLYPDHQKTPDALYKLGVVYHSLGDLESAKVFLARVQGEYPDSGAAELAAKYAAEL